MNNKGFSLIELIVVISLIAIVVIVVVKFSGNTVSLNEEEAYKIMKNSIINATDKYLLECESGLLECNHSWNNNKTTISVTSLIEAGYFKTVIDPTNNEDISKCLVIEVAKVNEDYKYKLNDEKCK